MPVPEREAVVKTSPNVIKQERPNETNPRLDDQASVSANNSPVAAEGIESGRRSAGFSRPNKPTLEASRQKLWYRSSNRRPKLPGARRK